MIVCAIASVLLGLFWGAAELSVEQIASCLVRECNNSVQHTIFWDIRFPRVIAGFLVGGGLAIAGASLQTLTRNSLADPYLFGVVAGAGLGASIAMVTHQFFPMLSAQYLLPLAAFTGALIAVVLVQSLVVSSFGSRIELMLLAGVAVSFMFGAISHFILYMAEPFAANTVIFWLLGSLARVEMWYVWLLLPVLLACLAVLYVLAPRTDALLLGDETAKSLGVNVVLLRAVLLCICALLTACIVAYCGGIGFVGLMIPHIVRKWLGVESRKVLIGCLLLGGVFIVNADTLTRVLLSQQELPIGIITAAIGSFFFLMVMRQSR
jgi:iron complex transport system permease protein